MIKSQKDKKWSQTTPTESFPGIFFLLHAENNRMTSFSQHRVLSYGSFNLLFVNMQV